MDALVGFIAGIVLGGIFFGGLYLTVTRLERSGNPAVLMIISLIVRMAVLLSGIYYLSQGDWRRIVGTLAGVMVSRFILIRLVREEKV